MRVKNTLGMAATSVAMVLVCACGGDDSASEGTPEETGSESSSDSATSDGESAGTSGSEGDSTSGGESSGESSGTSGGEGSSTDGEGLCGELACEDALVLDLSLQESVAATEVSSVADGPDWVSAVDATAGGSAGAAMNPWLYMKFTEGGLEKVDIDDFAALSSSEWDIAAKRFGIRVNSGSSGPGCVEVAAVDTAYGDVETAPDSGFRVESFYDDSCGLIEDSSGIGGPNYVMSSWWGYNGCVTTTEQTFVLTLGDERVVKLVVEAYYAEGQDGCNQSGAMGEGSAEMTWRWQPLE